MKPLDNLKSNSSAEIESSVTLNFILEVVNIRKKILIQVIIFHLPSLKSSTESMQTKM